MIGGGSGTPMLLARWAASMDYALTEHAKRRLAKRTNTRTEWVERALRQPDVVWKDGVDPQLEHRLVRIEQYGGRVLRVIVKTTETPLLVVTAFLDRRARKKLWFFRGICGQIGRT